MKEAPTIQQQIDNVRKTRVAREVRNLFLTTSEMIDIEKLPIKLEYSFTEDFKDTDIGILKALGLIVLGEE